jgi:transcriptional regulator with AAA-type ATPase domain
MDELTIHPGFMQSLILKTRALMAQEDLTMPDSSSNPTDDEASPVMLQDDPDNPLREEIRAEIEDLEPDQQAELVALMWIGRGDMEPEEWEDAVQLALERHEGSTADYLLSHPHVADYWDEGVDKLYDGSDLLETGEY